MIDKLFKFVELVVNGKSKTVTHINEDAHFDACRPTPPEPANSEEVKEEVKEEAKPAAKNRESCPLSRSEDGMCVYAHTSYKGQNYCFLKGCAENITGKNIECVLSVQRRAGIAARRAAIKAEETNRRRTEARAARLERGGFRASTVKTTEGYELTEGSDGNKFA